MPKSRGKVITARQRAARRKNIAIARKARKRTLSSAERKSLLAYDKAKRMRRRKESNQSDEFRSKAKRARKHADMFVMAKLGNPIAKKYVNKWRAAKKAGRGTI